MKVTTTNTFLLTGSHTNEFVYVVFRIFDHILLLRHNEFYDFFSTRQF